MLERKFVERCVGGTLRGRKGVLDEKCMHASMWKGVSR